MVEGKKQRIDEGARAVREHVAIAWDDARVEALIGRMRARRRRRAVVGSSLAAAAMIALAFVVSYAMWPGEAGAPPAVAAPVETSTEDDRVIHLADGSTVTPLDERAEIVVTRVSDEEILLDLVRGGARFDVVPGLRRAFRVQAGAIEVSVVGTVFEVRRDGEAAEVRVHEGRVRVSWQPDGEAFVPAGESGRFPREDEESASAPASVIAPAPIAPSEPAPAARPSVPAPRVRPSAAPAHAWLELAERGEYDQAVELLAADRSAIESSDLDTLLLASDTMRLTGHPDRALAFLDRADAVAHGDARASLVAFTRGRLLLTGMSRPRDAAEAFARARMLAPRGSLAMDALAREVEALSRAGDRDAARARAEEYVERYPNGLRIEAVRRWGGLTTE